MSCCGPGCSTGTDTEIEWLRQRRIREIQGEPTLEQLKIENRELRKILRQYEPPTLPTICEVCGKEYDQEVLYFDPGHHPNCEAEDRHAHSSTAADICTVCRLQGASP